MSDVVVGSLDEIPLGEGRTYAVDGEQVVVYRLRDGSLRALGAVCPHRGGPLADGLTDDDVVVCPLHGFTYDLCTGAETTGGADAARIYRVSAVDGDIRVTTGPA